MQRNNLMKIEKFYIEKDINVFFVTATSFPDGVPAAYEKLHEMITASAERKYFGISWPENGKIIYKAAAEELEEGEAEKYNCKAFTIKRGNYISILIKDHMKDGASIGNAFQTLLKHPGIDPKGYCLEWYINYADGDVRCLVGVK